MDSERSGLVDIVREFLDVHEQMRELFERYRSDDLDFESVRSLCGDNDGSALFRLKERCHSLFRDGGEDGAPMRREALFDLAVGSLFHEAMKFRENFYQQEVYAPKVEALRARTEGEDAELFREFAKILAGASARIDEALQESEALLALTAEQLRSLLSGRRDGLLTRYLVEERARIEAMLPHGLDELLTAMHGDVLEAHLAAANSYLESAHFRHALAALEAAQPGASEREGLTHLARYAQGMRAFMAGDYATSLDALEEWAAAGPDPAEQPFVTLAHSAISRVERLVKSDEEADLVQRAGKLVERLEPFLPPRPEEQAPEGGPLL